ncbi:uncharacterized protein LOC119682480 isoform X2 [Teleopsis dalmanni]|uniref:uncharacterized protein LOC119682329 isoform X2 n=1 Tax=Teleopsis dalmanni TaxID=139649 RepID=UPI0018CD034C|nr:uncharacterized protein LOC119682329 isoform X2 [Teleopsis dalmanni]XP_037951860.1 uncharacterized protein LOC119682480 isoform X2 [Teleopsis dalmanni]
MAESFRKNFKQKNALDWEEAGGEFYQETYSSEWEGFPTDNVITTLLPSKQNRLGTCRRIQRDSKDTKPNKYWQPIPTTKRNTYKNNELQNSLLPDLSEVLTDEGRIWEEILQIKLIPVPMEQKKELKIKLQLYYHRFYFLIYVNHNRMLLNSDFKDSINSNGNTVRYGKG